VVGAPAAAVPGHKLPAVDPGRPSLREALQEKEQAPAPKTLDQGSTARGRPSLAGTALLSAFPRTNPSPRQGHAGELRALRSEVTELREYRRLDLEALGDLETRLEDKTNEVVFLRTEVEAMRRHNQLVVESKAGIASQLEACHAALVASKGKIRELEATAQDLKGKLGTERQARADEARASRAAWERWEQGEVSAESKQGASRRWPLLAQRLDSLALASLALALWPTVAAAIVVVAGTIMALLGLVLSDLQ